MRLKTRCFIMLSLAVLVLPSVSWTTTWNINSDGTGDAATIQAGINLAASGDVVLLAPGTYTGVGNRDISFQGKAITVTSSGGAAVTIIDCQLLGRGFEFDGEGSTSVLSGVTIENGLPGGNEFGGAIFCLYAHPTIQNNIFRNNQRCAIVLDSSSSLIDNNEFFSNSRGAISCNFSNATVSGNRFENNVSDGSGGAVKIFESSGTVIDNVFDGNSATKGGGMSFVGFSTVVVSGNVFVSNTASEGGGGMYIDDNSPDVQGNTFSENDAPIGGGIYCHSLFYTAAPIVEKNIIVFSTQGEGIYCDGGSAPSLTCNDIFGNAGGDAFCGIDNGNNISADPIFCGAPGSGDYSIRFDSPCAPANSPCGALIGALPPQCSPLPVHETTWGALKAMYGNN